tara:strand:- start:803 stop:973 length:171 start_codon:yes stop_codon:yes gene_type:complete
MLNFRYVPLMVIVCERPIFGGWRTTVTAIFEFDMSIEVWETTSAGEELISSTTICS